MQVKTCSLAGMVKPFPLIDRVLKSQGFSRRGTQEMTYHLEMADTASNTIYYLRIPTRYKKGDHHRADPKGLLQLDHPYIGKQRGPDRFQTKKTIPPAVIDAAQHKMAEVASYLSTIQKR